MPITERQLQFSEGFVGPPTPRDQTGAGCPDMQNLMLTPGGGALRPFWGFWRTYPYNLLTSDMPYSNDTTGVITYHSADPGAGYTAVPSMLRVVTFPPEALLTGGGRGIGVVDEVTGRIMAIHFHAGGVPLDVVNVAADRPPASHGQLNRQSAHDYPTLLNFRNATHICTPWDEQRVWDGARLRKAGIRAPQLAPVVSGYSNDLVHEWDNGNVRMLIHCTSAVDGFDDPQVEIVKGDYIRFWKDYGEGVYDSYANVTENKSRIYTNEGSPGTVTELVAKINEAANWEATEIVGNLNVTADAVGTAGNAITLVSTAASVLVPATLLYGTAALAAHGQVLFTAQPTVGDLLTVGGTDVYEFGGTGANINVAIGSTVRLTAANLLAAMNGVDATIAVGATQPEETTNTVEDLLFPNVLGDSSDAKAVVSTGFGLGVAQPENYQYEVGGYNFCFAWKDSVTAQESAPSPYSTSISVISNEDLILDISGRLVNPPVGAGNFSPESRIDTVAIYVHRQGWANDDSTGFPQYRLLDEILYSDLTVTGEEILATVRAGRLRDEVEPRLLVDRTPLYDAGVPPAAQHCITDGNRLLWAGVPDYSVGRVKSELQDDGKYVLTKKLAYTLDSTGVVDYFDADPGAGYTVSPEHTPVFGPWLEGRQVALGTNEGAGLILKALPSSPGVYDRLWVQGLSAESVESGFVVLGAPNKVWYSTVNSLLGVQQESCGVTNFIELDMPGDAIQALTHIGTYAVAVGRENVTFLLQNTSAVDDVPASGVPYPRPRMIDGGTIGGRTVVELPSGHALWLSPEGTTQYATTDGIQEHPSSARFTGFVGSHYKLTQSMLRYAFGYYHERLGMDLLFFPEGSDDTFGKWADAPATDPHIDWTE